MIRSYVAGPWDAVVLLARIGLTITLFLIGAALSRKSITAVGVRPLVFCVILWLLISSVSLLVIYSNQISIS